MGTRSLHATRRVAYRVGTRCANPAQAKEIKGTGTALNNYSQVSTLHSTLSTPGPGRREALWGSPHFSWLSKCAVLTHPWYSMVVLNKTWIRKSSIKLRKVSCSFLIVFRELRSGKACLRLRFFFNAVNFRERVCMGLRIAWWRINIINWSTGIWKTGIWVKPEFGAQFWGSFPLKARIWGLGLSTVDIWSSTVSQLDPGHPAHST